jgi:hypothetical protein
LCRAGGSVSELVRHTETFIVRLWVEYLEQTPSTWRGEIEHVSGKQVVHFRNTNEMVDFMKSHAADKPIQPVIEKGEQKCVNDL